MSSASPTGADGLPAGAEPVADDPLDRADAGAAALRGGALRAVGYVAGIGLSLISVPILIRYLGVTGFGRYTAVVALIGIVTGLSEGGLNTIALRELSVQGSARHSVMRDLLGIRIVLTTLGVGAAVAFAALVGYDDVLITGTVAAGAGMLLISLQGLLASALQVDLRFGWATIADLARQALSVVLIVSGVLAGAGLLTFLAVPIPAGLLSLALTAWLVRRGFSLRPAFAVRRWWPLLRDTVPYAVAVAVNATYFRLAVVAMTVLSTDLETGYFATSFRVIEVLLAVPALGVAAAFPILARTADSDQERFDYAAGRVLDLAVVAGTLVAVVVVLGAPAAVDVLAGGEGRPAVAVLRIQAIGLVATFLAVAGGFALLSLRRERDVLLANGAALCAAVVLAVALIPAFNAQGAAVATTLTELVIAGTSLILLFRVRPALGRTMLNAPVVVLLGAAVAVGVLVIGLPSVAAVALGAALFVAALGLAGRFPPEVAEALRRT